jgi:hypothetical protein
MQPKDLLLKCYFEKDGDQWLGFSLDFSLVAQASSLKEAADKLAAQIEEYVFDAMAGQDRQHAGYLLRRRAPVSYWAKFYLTLGRQHWRHTMQASKRRKAVVESVRLAPVGCV